MNKKEFKKCMRRGLGRCVLALRSSDSIEKYKQTVLWGCLHNLSYDTQCEGTRANYIYELTAYFKDDDYFIIPTVESFEKISRRSDRLFSHLCELLCRFAEAGSDTAKDALQRKYDQLLSLLLSKRRSAGYDFERDGFERVCLALSSFGGIDILLKIANDMGHLFRENPHYSGDDFEWFCSSMSDGIGKKRLDAVFRREIKKSENISCFYQGYLKTVKATQNITQRPIEAPSAEDIKNEIIRRGELSPALRVRFSRHAESEEKRRLAESAIAEADPDVKAALLSAFAFRDEIFPAAPEALIEYSGSSHEGLRKVAFEVLTNCQGKAVREYALGLLADEKHRTCALKMLLCNYTPDIKELLLSELSKIKTDCSDEGDWHSIGSKILNVCDQNVKLPREFFIYIYETTLCSCCRERAIRALAKHRWMTREMIEECRYDSNPGISQYISRYYPTV